MSASFCWQCGGRLGKKLSGELVFEEYTLPGGAVVRMHKKCLDNVKDGIEYVSQNLRDEVRKRHDPDTL